LTGGLLKVDGEFDREEAGLELELVGLASLLLMETGSLELAPADACVAEWAVASAAATAVAVTVAAASAAVVVVPVDVAAGGGDL
jgi:hypothetical protein